MLAPRTLHAQCGLLTLPAHSVRRKSHAAGFRLPGRVVAVSASKKSQERQVDDSSYSATSAEVPEWARPAQPETYQAVAPAQASAAPPASRESFWSGIPPLIWIAFGVAVGAGLQKAVEFVKGGPQKMQQMAMEQMMKQMMNQMGGAGGAGANPFGAGPGANPFGGASPFGQPGSPFGGSGFPSGFPNMQPPIDTTAAAATAAPAGSSSASQSPSATSAPPSSAASSQSASAPTSTSTASSSSSPSSSSKKRSSFVDVEATPVKEASQQGAGAAAGDGDSKAQQGAAGAQQGGAMPPPPFQMPDMGAAGGMPFGAGAAAGAAGGAGGSSGMLEMLRDPEMQKMLYPYLPEPMRNPQTFEFMLNNPEYRQQLETMLQQQAGASDNPAIAEMMSGMDMSPENMKKQLGAMGMSPDQFIQKIMSDPELATSMTKPDVMAAIADCSKNPMNIFKYQDKPEVMRVFEKMSTLFPQPPGMGFPPQQ